MIPSIAILLTLATAALTPDRVAELVEQLDAPRLAQRQAAEAALIELGPAALEHLPEPEQTTSAETRLRLERVIAKLRAQATEGSIRPPEITVADVTVRPPAPSGEGGLLRVELKASWRAPPRIITLRQRMSNVRAIDARGRELSPANPRAVREVFVDRPAQTATLPIGFKLPAAPTDGEPGSGAEGGADSGHESNAEFPRLAELSGRMTVTWVAYPHTFRFERLPSDTTARQQVGEATVTLERFARVGEAYEARLRVKYAQPRGALASHRGWVFQNKAELLLPGDETVAPFETETYRQTGDEVGLAYRFRVEQLPAEAVLAYRLPTAIVAREVVYEIKDVEVPTPHD